MSVLVGSAAWAAHASEPSAPVSLTRQDYVTTPLRALFGTSARITLKRTRPDTRGLFLALAMPMKSSHNDDDPRAVPSRHEAPRNDGVAVKEALDQSQDRETSKSAAPTRKVAPDRWRRASR
jgi:hypothetical protein